MSKRFIASVASVVAGAGLTFGQAPVAVLPSGSAPAAATAPVAGAAPVVALDEPAAESSRLWFSGEYLLWWTKKSPESVPLVTTSAAAAVPGMPPPGALGGPGTAVVLGGSSIDLEERAGGRFTVGGWVDDDRSLGVEASYFFLAPRSSVQTVGSSGLPGSPMLFVPFNNVQATDGILGLFGAGVPVGENVAPSALNFANIPGTVPGIAGFSASTTSRSLFQGAEGNALFGVSNSSGLRIDGLVGFRYLSLNEDFAFHTTTASVPGFAVIGVPLGFAIDTHDGYHTDNDFYGGQVGVRGTYDVGSGLFVSVCGKVALGDMHERLDINGNTQLRATLTLPPGVIGNPAPIPILGGGPIAIPGGIFTQPTNIGTFSRDRFAVVPEVNAKVGYDVTSWARVTAGYTFLYINDVARASDQIDRNINLTRTGVNQFLPILFGAPTGPASPAPLFRQSSYWAQGLDFGLEFKY